MYGKSVTRTFVGAFFWAPIPFKDTKTHPDAALVTFTKEILDGKLHFLCSASCNITETFSSK